MVSPFDKIYTLERMTKFFYIMGMRNNGDMKVWLPKYQKWSDNDATIGYTNLFRLHFIANNKLKATGSARFTQDFVLGYGSYRQEGQKTGSMEMWAIAAHGKLPIFSELYENNDDKASKVLVNLISMGLRMNEVK
jgi:DNA-directed RNA polymerase beta subunit